MKIEKLQLVNFRSYDYVSLCFDRMLTVFYGKNGQGKTNLLESMFYAAFGLSHRTSKEEDMLKFATEGMAVSAEFSKGDGSHSIRMKRYFDSGKYKKEIKLDGKKVTAKDHYGYLNIVMFSPEDLQIVKGEPALRRRFLDMEISQTDPLYYDFLIRYRRVLRQRNSLLKIVREKNIPQSELDIWDEEISALNAGILCKRLSNIKKLKNISSSIFHVLSERNDILDLKYEMKENNGVRSYPEWKDIDEDKMRQKYLENLKERRFKDIMQGTTGIGIHRDDLKIDINQVDSKAFASQGQQRCCALALKMSQIEYVREITGEYPVLLLDDVMSELDQYRRRQLVGFINEKVQTFITVNDSSLIPDFSSSKYFEIQKGNIREA